MTATSATAKRFSCVASGFELASAELIEKDARMATASKVGASNLGRLRVP